MSHPAPIAKTPHQLAHDIIVCFQNDQVRMKKEALPREESLLLTSLSSHETRDLIELTRDGFEILLLKIKDLIKNDQGYALGDLSECAEDFTTLRQLIECTGKAFGSDCESDTNTFTSKVTSFKALWGPDGASLISNLLAAIIQVACNNSTTDFSYSLLQETDKGYSRLSNFIIKDLEGSSQSYTPKSIIELVRDILDYDPPETEKDSSAFAASGGSGAGAGASSTAEAAPTAIVGAARAGVLPPPLPAKGAPRGAH